MRSQIEELVKPWKIETCTRDRPFLDLRDTEERINTWSCPAMEALSSKMLLPESV
jgi:hypothetical protein